MNQIYFRVGYDYFELPTYADVEAAASRIAGVAHRTPVQTSRTLNEITDAEVFFKCENFQRMGAVKFRGVFNALSKFSPEQRKVGVVAFSSGNHAQGIALSAKILNIPAIIAMPHDAPAAKVAATKGYGATVVIFDRYTENREAIGRRIADEQGLTLIPSYDYPDVLSGQGTAAKELFEAVGALDYLFIPLGGGGLLSGCALSTRALAPNASCTESNRKPGMMASNLSAAARSCISTRRKPSRTERRPSISETTRSPSSNAM
ncbi:pyridoxal-phosphate dependent enzyme [Paraburkholderia sp. GV068]|nr:pyridoxal-phosphate dependent enzyme [Paraburkholderia sp. GV072]PUA94292.1 pyridoxal-phosphate dependent enzyme [Paraburkholderia sp. GV068]